MTAHATVEGGALLEAAAEWYFLLDRYPHDVEEEVARRFRQWLSESPANVRAYEQVQATMQLVSTAEAGEVLASMPREHDAWRPNCRVTRGWLAGGAMRYAAAIALVLGLIGLRVGWQAEGTRTAEEPLIATTAIGEHSVVTLTDGSQLELDENSSVSIAFSGTARRITLMRGQVRFSVAHDPARPFIVSAGDRSVVAIGTEFGVERAGGSLSVYLLEGRVKITAADKPIGASPRSGDAADTMLSPGNQWTRYSDGRTVIRQVVDPRKAFAWQNGQILLNNERLVDVIPRLNRYGPPTLKIDDPRLSGLAISGVFNTRNRDGFLEAVASMLPVQVVRQGGEVHLTCRDRLNCT